MPHATVVTEHFVNPNPNVSMDDMCLGKHEFYFNNERDIDGLVPTNCSACGAIFDKEDRERIEWWMNEKMRLELDFDEYGRKIPEKRCRNDPY